MRILLIQSRSKPESVARERRNFSRAIGQAAQLDFLSALDGRLVSYKPQEILENHDAVIFGGSPEYDLHGDRSKNDPARVTARLILKRVRPIISHALDEDFPLLGICFGHQLVAEIHGGEIKKDPSQGKFGAYEVRLTKDGREDDLFKNMPESFFAAYEHNDSVTVHPKGTVLLARGPSCRFSALRYGSNAYTVQFHPEITRPSPGRDLSIASRLVRFWIEGVAPKWTGVRPALQFK